MTTDAELWADEMLAQNAYPGATKAELVAFWHQQKSELADFIRTHPTHNPDDDIEGGMGSC